MGKARPGPRTLRALPEHPAEVAVPRVWPWRGRGRWPVRLAFCGGEGRPGSCFPPAPSHLCKCCGVAASSPVVRARARVGHGGGRAQGREHKSVFKGIQWLACCVWFRCCSLVPVPVSRLREAARHSRRGVVAWAGRMGSGGRPRRMRRHAGAGPVAVAGGCGRSSRRSAVAPRAPHSGVGERAGGGRALQVMLRGAHAQGRRRARWGPFCGPRDLRLAGCTARGLRPGPGAWVAAGGRGGSGAMRVRGPWRSRGGAGVPAGGRQWPREPHTVGSVGVPGASASCRPSCGGRTRKGAGVLVGGPSAGRGTCGEQEALLGG